MTLIVVPRAGPAALRAEIEAVLEDAGRLDASWTPRANHFLGRRIRSAGWHRDKVLRLFDRAKGSYEPLHVHAEVQIESGRVGTLREPLLHHTYRDLDQYFEKFHRYTRWSADDLRDRGVRASPSRLLFRAPLRFLRMYSSEGFPRGAPRHRASAWRFSSS